MYVTQSSRSFNRRRRSLCGYLLRPPLALERLTETTGGQLLSQLPRPWSDGSTARRWDPLEWLERVVALVPAPRRPWLPATASWRHTVQRDAVLRLQSPFELGDPFERVVPSPFEFRGHQTVVGVDGSAC